MAFTRDGIDAHRRWKAISVASLRRPPIIGPTAGGVASAGNPNPSAFRFMVDHEPLLTNPLFEIGSLVAGSTLNGNPQRTCFQVY